MSENFFNQPNEITFRSFGEIIKKINKKYYLPRGKSINAITSKIKSNNFTKATLGGCVVQKIGKTIAVFPERP